MRTYQVWQRTLGFVVVALLFILSACSQQHTRVPTAAPEGDAPPIEAVKAFVQALESQDANALINLIEPTDWRNRISHELRTYMAYIEDATLENATYTLEESSDTEATVRVTGVLKATLKEKESEPLEHDVDMLVEVVNVDGTWYLRDIDLDSVVGEPESSAAPRWTLPGFGGGASVALAQGSPSNDPMYSDQWALDTLGAPCAWEYTTGSAEVIVAVVDSGVDMTHPDLVDRLRTDGYDFVDDDDDPSDENCHGTHVSGIIAATLNNAEGVAGLAPNVSILPVRVMDAEGWGSDPDIAAGIRYAYENGAKVINMSLGVTVMGSEDTSPEISAAISEAQDAGALVVVASGNDFVPLPNGIASDNPDVMVVAASTPSDEPAPFANTGPWVDVTAPGDEILATLPTYEVFMTSDMVPPEERFNQDYDYLSGTSMAAPYASALAALLFSAHPDWTPNQVQDTIKETSFEGIYENLPAVYQRLGLLGAGRMDACAALESAPPDAGAMPLPTPPAADPTMPSLDPDPPVDIDDQAPVETVKAFMNALIEGNLDNVNNLIEGSSEDNPEIGIGDYLDIANQVKQFEDIEYTLEENNGEEAIVEMTFVDAGEERLLRFIVVKIGPDWYIRDIE